MGFYRGGPVERRAPCCGAELLYDDYEHDPPPIPPHPRTGSFASYSSWYDPALYDPDPPARGWIDACPACGEQLRSPA